MKSLSKRERILLLILGIAVIGYLYYALLFVPVQRKIENAKMNIDKYAQEINNARIMSELGKKQTSELEMIKTKFEEAKILLPQMEKNPEIIFNIKKFFDGSGVEVSSITVGQPENFVLAVQPEGSSSGGQNTSNSNTGSNNTGTGDKSSQDPDKMFAVPVMISLTADNYEQVMKFISLFENDRRFVEITDMKITANRPAPQPVVNVNPAPQPAAPKVEKKTDEDKIEVVVVGEGEEYKEIPIEGDKTDQVDSQDKVQSQPVVPPVQSSNNPEASKPKIEVTVTARYYYISSNTETVGEPAYTFSNTESGKKDLFKK